MDEVIRVRWVWVVLTALLCVWTSTAGLLVTYRPVSNGQWSTVSGRTGSVSVTGASGAQVGSRVDVAVPGEVVSAVVTAIRTASEGRSAVLGLELDQSTQVAPGDPVSVRFAATPILRGLVWQ